MLQPTIIAETKAWVKSCIGKKLGRGGVEKGKVLTRNLSEELGRIGCPIRVRVPLEGRSIVPTRFSSVVLPVTTRKQTQTEHMRKTESAAQVYLRYALIAHVFAVMPWSKTPCNTRIIGLRHTCLQ